MKIALLVASTLVLIVAATIGYNLYTEAEKRNLSREQYEACLKLTEQLLKEKPDRISTPYCRN